MYKKRFAKWGFQKNSRRSSPPDTTCCTEEKNARSLKVKRKPRQIRTCFSVSPGLSQKDALFLSFLTNVRDWNAAFFEPALSGDGFSTIDLASPERAKETSCTPRLVSDLLTRGHGLLAGRLARKAFLLVEDILSLDGPALVRSPLRRIFAACCM